MDKQYQLLDYLDSEKNTSQRAIAEKIGISLGSVNLLLRKMIDKGLVKTERLDARSLRYIVTPKGLAKKMKLAYMYSKNTYLYIRRIMNITEQIINDAKETGFYNVYLLGNIDEVYEIIKIALKENGVSYTYIDNPSQVNNKNSLYILWEPEIESKIPKGYKTENILKHL